MQLKYYNASCLHLEIRRLLFPTIPVLSGLYGLGLLEYDLSTSHTMYQLVKSTTADAKLQIGIILY